MKEPKRNPGVNYVPSQGYAPDKDALKKIMSTMPPKAKEALKGIEAHMPAKITERKVPTVFRTVLKFEWFRTFSFWERIQILFGCNLVVMSGVATQHRPGEYQPLLVGRVSYQKNATDHMQKIVENMIEERLPDIGPLNNLEPQDPKK